MVSSSTGNQLLRGSTEIRGSPVPESWSGQTLPETQPLWQSRENYPHRSKSERGLESIHHLKTLFHSTYVALHSSKSLRRNNYWILQSNPISKRCLHYFSKWNSEIREGFPSLYIVPIRQRLHQSVVISGSTDVGAMCGSVELLQLLAGVREKAGREREARQALEQARETQTK